MVQIEEQFASLPLEDFCAIEVSLNLLHLLMHSHTRCSLFWCLKRCTHADPIYLALQSVKHKGQSVSCQYPKQAVATRRSDSCPLRLLPNWTTGVAFLSVVLCASALLQDIEKDLGSITASREDVGSLIKVRFLCKECATSSQVFLESLHSIQGVETGFTYAARICSPCSQTASSG